jgi:hypothetical protein
VEWIIRLEARTGSDVLETLELMSIRRDGSAVTAADVGLTLTEAKSLLTGLQAAMVRGQVGEYVRRRQVCASCAAVQPLKDRRTRRLKTPFGTIEIDAPRFKSCRCRRFTDHGAMTFSPVGELLPGICTPELEQTHAEIGARTSFRGGAAILERLLPVSPVSHVTIREKLHSAARRLETNDAALVPPVIDKRERKEFVIALDGAHIRSSPGYETRHFEAVVGKAVVSGRPDRRFALAGGPEGKSAQSIHAALVEQGSKDGQPVTVISGGDLGLPTHAAAAAGRPVRHILDWFHLSMRVRHVEQALKGLKAMNTRHQRPVDYMAMDVGRLRHLLWNGYHEEAHLRLASIVSMCDGFVFLNGPAVEAKACRFVELCETLKTYLSNNRGAIIDYSQRRRRGKPISTSRAESLVNQMVNARMNERRQMRWCLGARIES